MDPQIGQMVQNAVQNPPQTDEGQQLLNGFTGAEQDVQVNNASEYYNLAQDLPTDKQSEIGKEIKNGYQDDDSSRSDWLDMHTFWLSLYMQTDAMQNAVEDRDWGATESIPILTESANQFQGRTFKTFFPQPEFISAKVLQHTLDPVKQQNQDDRADRIGRHMSWQLGVQNKYYKKDKSGLFLGVAVHGSFFTKTYFDAQKTKKPKIQNIRPTDLVINYNIGSIRIEDVRRKSHVIYSTVGECQQYVQDGYFSQAALGGDGDSRSQYNVAVDEAQGLTPGQVTVKRDRPVTLIEQHFYLDLEDNGNYLPYIGTIELSTGRLLRLTLGYESDPMGNPSKDYEQCQYFTHYKFMENPDGFYGLGLGHMIGDLNSAVNIMTRQVMDAATLANDGNMGGFISERLCMNQEDEITMTLGKMVKIPDQTGDLTNGIMMMKFPGPNEALMQIIEQLDQRAQRLGSTTEATTGTIDTNRQPTTVLSQIDQSLELFSSVQMGLADSLQDELDKVYKINQKYLPLVEYFAINDAPQAITRADYQDDMTVEPIFDPKFSTRAQKIAKAQAELQATMQNPLSQQRPWVFDVAFRRYLEALETENIDQLIPPPQPMPPPMMGPPNGQPPQANNGPAPPMANGPPHPMGASAGPTSIPAALGVPANQAGGAGNGQLAGRLPSGV